MLSAFNLIRSAHKISMREFASSAVGADKLPYFQDGSVARAKALKQYANTIANYECEGNQAIREGRLTEADRFKSLSTRAITAPHGFSPHELKQAIQSAVKERLDAEAQEIWDQQKGPAHR